MFLKVLYGFEDGILANLGDSLGLVFRIKQRIKPSRISIVLKMNTEGHGFEIIGGYTELKEYIDEGLHLESDRNT